MGGIREENLISQINLDKNKEERTIRIVCKLIFLFMHMDNITTGMLFQRINNFIK